MPKQDNSSVELLINALNNEKVLDTLAKTLQPLIQAAVDNAVDKLSNELKLRNEIIDQLKKDNDDLKMKLQHQAKYLDDIETYSKQENLIIHGLPTTSMSEAVGSSQQPTGTEVRTIHETSRTTESTFLDFCRTQLRVDIHPTDISICHRLKKRDNMSYPPVIVRFANRKSREAVYSARRMLRSSTNRNQQHVYINEHLTQNTSKTFGRARALVRNHQLLQAWTYHGKVTVKQLDNQVKTINDLSELNIY